MAHVKGAFFFFPFSSSLVYQSKQHYRALFWEVDRFEKKKTAAYTPPGRAGGLYDHGWIFVYARVLFLLPRMRRLYNPNGAQT